MMLHRHFEDNEQKENVTTLADVTPHTEFVSAVFPPDEETAEAPKRGKRSTKKQETDK